MTAPSWTSAPCLVCGTDLMTARRPWAMVDTAAGLLPVCDDHSAGELRDAHLSVERPEVLDGGEPR